MTTAKRSLLGLIIVVMFTLISLPNQATKCDVSPSSDNVQTVMNEIELLIRIAENQHKKRDERAAAIFRLFANHLRPGDSASRFQSVFKQSKWLRESTITRITMLAGWIPIECGPNIFCLELFPTNESKDSRWLIYFSLSGFDTSYHYGGNELEFAMSFLYGDCIETVRIVDFALCEYRKGNLFPQITRPIMKKKKARNSMPEKKKKKREEKGSGLVIIEDR